MSAIQAIYENGVFRPIVPVDLPNGTLVSVEPGKPAPSEVAATDPQLAHLEPGLARVYATLLRSYDDGDAELAERHNEHQP